MFPRASHKLGFLASGRTRDVGPATGEVLALFKLDAAAPAEDRHWVMVEPWVLQRSVGVVGRTFNGRTQLGTTIPRVVRHNLETTWQRGKLVGAAKVALVNGACSVFCLPNANGNRCTAARRTHPALHVPEPTRNAHNSYCFDRWSICVN